MASTKVKPSRVEAHDLYVWKGKNLLWAAVVDNGETDVLDERKRNEQEDVVQWLKNFVVAKLNLVDIEQDASFELVALAVRLFNACELAPPLRTKAT